MHKRGIQFSQERIYLDLSKKEKLVLLYLLHRRRAGSNEFTDSAGGGVYTLFTLKTFGLVEGYPDNSLSIKSPFLEQYGSFLSRKVRNTNTRSTSKR